MVAFKRLAVFFVLAGTLHLAAQQYQRGPDLQRQPGVPKGVVTKYILSPGKFYPGTPHNYSLYVPNQYLPGTPASLIIFLDGSGFLRDSNPGPTLLDNLIAKHDLPTTLAIFIDPGVLPTLSDKAQNRYERIFEYDSLSDRFANFLVEELIPEVGKKYNLSNDPNARALVGVSTGAVGAFMAAWNRPDQFRRVLSFIGTYVAMKGADSLPALIRKTEPKPIRIFLQDGKNDHLAPNQPWGTFFAGSWPINNEVMFQALSYAGYEVKLEIGGGAHDMVQGAVILPDALRWLWRGFPAPITVREPAALNQPGWDPRGKALSFIAYDQPWEKIAGNYGEITSLTRDGQGNVLFLDSGADRVYRVNAESGAVEAVGIYKGAKAIAVGNDNRLYVAQPERRRIVSYAADGHGEKLYAQNVVADYLAARPGQIFFINGPARTIGVAEPGGKVRAVYEGKEIVQPTGMAFSPDHESVVVSDGAGRFSWSFQVATQLQNGEPFFRLEMPESGPSSGVGGVAYDETGQVYFATPTGIQICEPNGRLATILNPPEPGSIREILFGGKNWRFVYVAEGHDLYRRPLKIAGAAPFTPVKPPKPLL